MLARKLLFLFLVLVIASSSCVWGSSRQWIVHGNDCGTGLAVYIEFPSDQPGKRPVRLLYDTGKARSKGIHNDLIRFLTSEEVGLQVADGDFEGDIIDFFICSHPHTDHYYGGKAVFDLFDVRNVMISKLSHSITYLKRFQAPAIDEIIAAKRQGKDANFIILALPYPNGFDQDRLGKAYNEYALAEANFPPFIRGKINAKVENVAFPFGADEVAQNVEIPVRNLMAEYDKAIDKYLDPENADAVLECQILPLGVQYRFGRYGGFTLLHADTVAPFDYEDTTTTTYKKAWPYYRQCDLNDLSIALQAFYKNATVLVPGDCEGRWSKPSKIVALDEVFGSPEGSNSYSEEDVRRHLKLDEAEGQQIPLIESAHRYVMSSKDLYELAFYAFATFDKLTPKEFTTKVDGEKIVIPANDYSSPEDIPDDIISLSKRSESQRASLHPQWRKRLFRLHLDLKLNRQKYSGLKTRFKYWCRGNNPRLVYDRASGDFRLNWEADCWSIINLVQLTERIYYVDPGLANILAGLIMSSDLFLEYMNPSDPEEKILRAERHMLHVAEQIAQESPGTDVLDSDVIFFGHHGSFTSSSVGFIRRVDPNVGIISADDKSYSGSTLPDFSALFWNLNTKHPEANAILHSIFFHADVLAKTRGESLDEYAVRSGLPGSAAKVFNSRKNPPIPLWRTDLNDDLINRNTLLDNILIQSNGDEPIWYWVKPRQGERPHPYCQEIVNGIADDPDRFTFWTLELVSAHPSGGKLLRPYDPSGTLTMFDVDDIAQEVMSNAGEIDFDAYRASDLLSEEWELGEPEDWTLRGLEEPTAP